jgi:hypothetical protein
MDKTRKAQFIDPKTGEYNLNYNVQNLLEDFYIPVRGGDSGTSIENLGGLEYNAIDDIEYLRNKMMAALRIPKAFFGYDESISGKTTLAAEDVRFARTVERIQRIVISELTKIAIIHLYAQGYTDDQLVNFDLAFASPSVIYEQEKINLWREKIGLASDAINSKLLSSDWVYENIFNLAEDERGEQRKKVIEDVKRTFRHMQIEQGQSDPAKFGYPQDKEQPAMDAMGGMGGGAPEGDAGGATDAAMGQANEVGRPEEGMKYGQDSHPRGRDPIGGAGYANFDEENPRRRKKSPLSLEAYKIVKNLDEKFKPKPPANNPPIITEIDTDRGTFLDERLIQEIDEGK